MIVHASDLKSMARCGEQHRRQRTGQQGQQLSATAFGSVMHHALHVLERGRDLPAAVATFEHYWHPLNIDQICEPVDIWIGRQTYSSLLQKGRTTLRQYWDLKQFDDEEVLALEIPFAVPMLGSLDEQTGETNMLLGTIDRLAVRSYHREMHLCVDDWKTGIKPAFLQHHVQFSLYAYATQHRKFWCGNPEYLTEGFGPERGDELFRRLANAPRHGWWIDVMGGPKWADCGLRGPRDYKRLLHAVNTYVRAVQHDIYQLNIDGSVCTFCPYRDNCPEGL